jgi:hypothetical protein
MPGANTGLLGTFVNNGRKKFYNIGHSLVLLVLHGLEWFAIQTSRRGHLSMNTLTQMLPLVKYDYLFYMILKIFLVHETLTNLTWTGMIMIHRHCNKK